MTGPSDRSSIWGIPAATKALHGVDVRLQGRVLLLIERPAMRRRRDAPLHRFQEDDGIPVQPVPIVCKVASIPGEMTASGEHRVILYGEIRGYCCTKKYGTLIPMTKVPQSAADGT